MTTRLAKHRHSVDGGVRRARNAERSIGAAMERFGERVRSRRPAISQQRGIMHRTAYYFDKKEGAIWHARTSCRAWEHMSEVVERGSVHCG